jgi:hypothetical protein
MADRNDDVYGRLDAWLERRRDAAFPYQSEAAPPLAGHVRRPDDDNLPLLTDLVSRGDWLTEGALPSVSAAPATDMRPAEIEALLAELEAEILVRFRARMQVALLQSAEDIADRLSRELSSDLLARLKSLIDKQSRPPTPSP